MEQENMEQEDFSNIFTNLIPKEYEETFKSLGKDVELAKMLANDPLVAKGLDSAVKMINYLLLYIDASDI